MAYLEHPAHIINKRDMSKNLENIQVSYLPYEYAYELYSQRPLPLLLSQTAATSLVSSRPCKVPSRLSPLCADVNQPTKKYGKGEKNRKTVNKV